MRILLTGGAGYIGSHTCVELLENGYDIVVIDDFSNSTSEVLENISMITGVEVGMHDKITPFLFYNGDVRDRHFLDGIFSEHEIDLVIHFAGLKSVGDSVLCPLDYYDCNVNGTLVLCAAMQAAGVKRMIFSSSATVYGNPHSVPIKESFPLCVTNPYGRSKLFIEEVLQDLHRSDSEWSIVLLRYFNPVGAHKSGLIGESPRGVPNNLMPYINQVAAGELKELSIFGGDYPTVDGTGVRDYIHVVDLAKGHTKSIIWNRAGVLIVNLGTGVGYSVLEMLLAFEKSTGCKVPYNIVERRDGDIPECYADPSYAKEVLGWEAEFGLEDMCKDAWGFQQRTINNKSVST